MKNPNIFIYSLVIICKMSLKKIISTLHPLERKVLPVLRQGISFDSIVRSSNLKKVEVMRALQWLENKKIVILKKKSSEIINLDENGKKYLKEGLPEKRFLKNLAKETTIDAFKKEIDFTNEEFNICVGLLRKKAVIYVLPGKKIKLTEQGKKQVGKETLEEKFLNKLPISSSKLLPEEKFAYEGLKKRKKIIKTDIIKKINVNITPLCEEILKSDMMGNYIDALTPEILKNSAWKNKNFRGYDVSINVPRINGGRRHFVNQAINHIKRIWLDLGFKEMTGSLIQTSFWNLDALFVPQDHPARDMQDTFYIKGPKYGKLPKDFAKRVKDTHENGWTTGSKGWQYKWSEEAAKENLLRTHTTVLSAKTIATLKKEDLPAKFFSVGKVFRNEVLNWKHLFELQQVEGIVIDPDANFKNLIGYLKEFFKKMGFPDVRVRPGHFPYTEPSAEVDVLHPVKKEWVELGGSGIFRPEVTKPLLGFECPVLAWGLGMERSIMEYYNITDIRKLYKNDLKQLREIKAWMR